MIWRTKENPVSCLQQKCLTSRRVPFVPGMISLSFTSKGHDRKLGAGEAGEQREQQQLQSSQVQLHEIGFHSLLLSLFVPFKE